MYNNGSKVGDPFSTLHNVNYETSHRTAAHPTGSAFSLRFGLNRNPSQTHVMEPQKIEVREGHIDFRFTNGESMQIHSEMLETLIRRSLDQMSTVKVPMRGTPEPLHQ